MRVSKFSLRIIGITLLAVLLTALAVNTLSLNEHRNLYIEKSIRNLDALAENLSELLLPYLVGTEDIPSIATTLLQLDRHESTLFASVFDNTGQQIFVYVNPQVQDSVAIEQQLPQMASTALGTQFINNLIISKKIIGDVDFSVGHLVIVQDPEPSLAQSERSYLQKVIPLLFIIATLVGFIAFSMQKRVLQKLNLVTSFVGKIKETGNKSERLLITEQDEIGLLAQQINDYLDTIKSYEQKIELQLSDLEHNKRNLEKMANYDVLTGLPNRKMLHDILRTALAKAQRKGSDLAVLYFDLDNFKHINDTLGHEVGDKLLLKVGERVSHLIREGDVLARLGGDEFVVVLLGNDEDKYDSGEVEVLAAQRLTNHLKKPFSIDKWEVSTAASIGIAHAKQANYDVELLMRNADIAMYQAKRDLGGCYAFFATEMHLNVQRRHEIANSMLRAIQDKQLYVVYQAKYNQAQQVTGFEALLRWQHPVLGNISPVEFIDVAEKTGKVSELTVFVIETVLADLCLLIDCYGDSTSVAINLSAHDLKNSQFRQQTLARLAQDPVYAANIQFELTESAYLDNFNTVNQFVKEIHLAGCHIALDDFGTGYSSLSYLTRLSIDLLKIDRSFITNMENGAADRVIVETIIQLANTLNIAVCAEGVETQSQFDYLAKIGCQFYQGYYFAKPLPLSQLLDNYNQAVNIN